MECQIFQISTHTLTHTHMQQEWIFSGFCSKSIWSKIFDMRFMDWKVDHKELSIVLTPCLFGCKFESIKENKSNKVYLPDQLWCQTDGKWHHQIQLQRHVHWGSTKIIEKVRKRVYVHGGQRRLYESRNHYLLWQHWCLTHAQWMFVCTFLL